MEETVLAGLAPLEPVVVYCFGSFGTDRQHDGSDLDLAILCPTALDPVRLFDLSNQLSEQLDLQVEVVDLSSATTVMRKEVIRTGERLKASDLEVARRFEMQTLSDYARLNEERAEILAR